MKTNKSLKKRIVKKKKDGTILVRKPGKGHFNAKKRRVKQLAGRKHATLKLKNKTRARLGQ